ncbi:MAG: 1-phosphofructokinase, partial [Treponema sp.]|nr:1-phosphofructokinase [Treponema sp.]
MVYTLTVNPSIDYIVSVQNFSTGKVNRSASENVLAGGKGINVSTVLNNLGVENVALGFVAGFTGEKIESLLNEKAVRTDFIHLENGMSRINVKLQSDVETEINARGP